MKSLIMGMVLLSTSAVFAQDTEFDYKAERARLNLEIESNSVSIQKLYKDLYDDQGNEDPAVKAKIDILQARIQVDSAKTQYLWTVGFEGINEKYRKSDVLKHFKRAKNRFAAVTAKDSKGQIISHETSGDIINDLYDKDIAQKYGCSNDVKPEITTPYDENQEEQASQVMNTLGYANYKELVVENRKTYCAIDESDSDVETIVECNDFISGVRLSLLETFEEKTINQAKDIKKRGYLNATDDMFLKYDLINGLKNEVEDQVTNIEAACLDKRLKNTDEVFSYLEDEIQKNGITIEYTIFNTSSNTAREE